MVGRQYFPSSNPQDIQCEQEIFRFAHWPTFEQQQQQRKPSFAQIQTWHFVGSVYAWSYQKTSFPLKKIANVLKLGICLMEKWILCKLYTCIYACVVYGVVFMVFEISWNIEVNTSAIHCNSLVLMVFILKIACKCHIACSSYSIHITNTHAGQANSQQRATHQLYSQRKSQCTSIWSGIKREGERERENACESERVALASKNEIESTYKPGTYSRMLYT